MSKTSNISAGSVEQATRDNLAGPMPLMRSSEILGSGISLELPSADSASSHRSVAGVGVDGTVSASAALPPYLLAPVEPAAVEVGEAHPMRKTFLAQNQFNSDVHVPETSGSAAADSCPQTLAAAAPIQVSDGVGAKPILASSPSEAAIVSVRAPVAADLSDWDINGSENIHEIFAYARKLCREQSPAIENHRFAPNYSGMFQAAVNEEVWDAPPMFLRGSA